MPTEKTDEQLDEVVELADQNYLDGITWHHRCQCGAWGTCQGKGRALAWIKQHFDNKHDGGKGLLSITATAWARGHRDEVGLTRTRIVR